MQSILIIVLAALLNSGAIPVCVTMDYLMVGTQYGTPSGQKPGDLAFIENNVTVRVEGYQHPGGPKNFLSAKIQKASTFGKGNTIQVSYINLSFDFKGIGAGVRKVTIDFFEKAPLSNFSVNGNSLHKGSLTKIPPIRGLKINTSFTSKGNQHKGTIEVTGMINTLTIGGVELSLDNICAY